MTSGKWLAALEDIFHRIRPVDVRRPVRVGFVTAALANSENDLGRLYFKVHAQPWLRRRMRYSSYKAVAKWIPLVPRIGSGTSSAALSKPSNGDHVVEAIKNSDVLMVLGGSLSKLHGSFFGEDGEPSPALELIRARVADGSLSYIGCSAGSLLCGDSRFGKHCVSLLKGVRLAVHCSHRGRQEDLLLEAAAAGNHWAIGIDGNASLGVCGSKMKVYASRDGVWVFDFRKASLTQKSAEEIEGEEAGKEAERRGVKKGKKKLRRLAPGEYRFEGVVLTYLTDGDEIELFPLDVKREPVVTFGSTKKSIVPPASSSGDGGDTPAVQWFAVPPTNAVWSSDIGGSADPERPPYLNQFCANACYLCDCVAAEGSRVCTESTKGNIVQKVTLTKTKETLRAAGRSRFDNRGISFHRLRLDMDFVIQKEDLSVFKLVTCDGCRQKPMKGGRYKCTTRYNYDLCTACWGKRRHFGMFFGQEWDFFATVESVAVHHDAPPSVTGEEGEEEEEEEEEEGETRLDYPSPFAASSSDVAWLEQEEEEEEEG